MRKQGTRKRKERDKEKTCILCVWYSYFRFHFYSSHSIIVSTFSSLVREVSCFLQLPLSLSFSFSFSFFQFLFSLSSIQTQWVFGIPSSIGSAGKTSFLQFIFFTISCHIGWGFLIQIAALLKLELRLIDSRLPFEISPSMIMGFCVLGQLVFQTGDGTFPRWPSECWQDFSCQFNCCELLACFIAICLIYCPQIQFRYRVLLSWPCFHIALMFGFVCLQTGGYSEDMIPTVCIFVLFLHLRLLYVWRLWACFPLHWNVILAIIKPRLDSTWEKWPREMSR